MFVSQSDMILLGFNVHSSIALCTVS